VGCQSDGSGGGADLQGPTAVTSVNYDTGKTCSDVASRRLAAAYTAFNAKMTKRVRHESTKLERRQWNAFFASQGLAPRAWAQAAMPRCAPVGWVSSSAPKLTTAQVTSPVKVAMSEGTRFCVKKSETSNFNGAIPCDRRVPRGDHSLYATMPARKAVLVSVSFTAHQSVTTTNSYYEMYLDAPGNNGGEGNSTQKNIRAGQRVTFSTFETSGLSGVYHGTIGFIPNVGQAGAEHSGGDPGHDGSLTVGTFSFKLPLTK
jgi:hypothetical protein